MTTEADILGRPPVMRPIIRDTIGEIEGPTFAELCAPISARHMSPIPHTGREGDRLKRRKRVEQ